MIDIIQIYTETQMFGFIAGFLVSSFIYVSLSWLMSIRG